MKWLEAAKTLVMVDDMKEMTANKSCKYGEFGLFEHLPFVLCLCSVAKASI